MSSYSISVASVAYNLAGDTSKRPDVLKTTVLQAMYGRTSQKSLANNIVYPYLNGSGVRLRNYATWAETSGYNAFIGKASGTLQFALPPNLTTVESFLDPVPNYTQEVLDAKIVKFEAFPVCVEYLLTNYPALVDTAWTFTVISSAITITFEDTTTESFPHTVGETDFFILGKRKLTNTLDPLDVIASSWYVYRYGSGSIDLDALMVTGSNTDLGDFYPIIPLRINNTPVTATTYPDMYEFAKKAVYQQTGKSSYDKLLDSLEDNPDIGDIDYAYNVIGVSLNTKDNAGKEYLFNFFNAIHEASLNHLTQDKKILIRANNLNINYDIEISWYGIDKVTGAGLYEPSAKKGMYFTRNIAHNAFRLVHQKSETEWEYMFLASMVYRNNIYSGNKVTITAYEAMMDPEESSFIVPLSIPLFKQMSIIKSTQLATNCSYLLINVYEAKKKKWYQTGLFKVIAVLAAIILTIYTGGFGTSTIGLLGSSAGIGATLGFQGLAAIVVGSAVNALAGMIVMQIISATSIKLFGNELGIIIAAVASLTLGALGSGKALSELFNPNTLLQLTKAGSESYQAYVNRRISEMGIETSNLTKKYNDVTKEINSKSEALGFNSGIDTYEVSYLIRKSNYSMFETPEEFFRRTLTLGSDIVNTVLSYPDNMLRYTEVN